MIDHIVRQLSLYTSGFGLPTPSIGLFKTKDSLELES